MSKQNELLPAPKRKIKTSQYGEVEVNNKAQSLISMALAAGGVLVSSPEHTLNQRLQERRISPEVIQEFDIQPRRDGWQYPTPGGGLRWKNANKKNGAKYAWLDGKSESASDLYYLDDLLLSVQASGGACYLASGEPDLWALRSAGIPNALCGFSENTVNPELADKLQSMGVLDLYIFPDLDKTGKAWAGKVARAVKDSGIELHCKRLPDSLGDRGDVGKLWQRYTKPNAQFERDLLTLPRWIPTPETAKEPTKGTYNAFYAGDIPADFKEPIEQALGVEGYDRDGFSNVVLCIFHNDHKPQAYLGYAGLYCHTCGTTYNWNALSDRLGLPTLAEYYQAQAVPAATVAPVIVGLSLETMAALVSCGFTSLARVLYVLYSNGWEGGQVVTVKDIKSICLIHGISERTVRNALLITRGELPKNKKPKNEQANNCLHFLQVFNTRFSLQRSTVLKSANNSKRGRKEEVHRLPTRDEINEALGIASGTYYLIKPEKLESPKTFRAALLEAFIKLNPGEHTRKALGKQAGVKGQTTRAYCELEGIKTKANYKRTKLTPSMIGAMPTTHQGLIIARKNGAMYAQIEAIKKGGTSGLEEGQTNKTSRLYSPCLESIERAYEFAGDGGKVEEVIRLANSYAAKDG
jgi:hypothetical protein